MLLTLLCLPFASAWGSLGHRTVAYLASMYFTTPSTVLTNHLLNGQDISEAALFPDKVRHMPQFSWSAGWHFIDARDDPPRHCGINMTRDCGEVTEGCVVSAIANHTHRVANESLPQYYRGQSLRFMMHFFGDVHQPLHTEAEDRGGNDYAVVFDGRATNLHSVWDTLIPNKLAASRNESSSTSNSDDEMLAAWEWARTLYDEDQSLDDECVTDPAECGLEWATEANAYVCAYVFAKDVHGQDLAGDYYDGAVPIVDELVAKAGRRLAVWINSISKSASDGAALLQTQ